MLIRFEVSNERALSLDSKHSRDQTLFPSNNPSSGMHLLLSSIEPGRPRLAD